MQSSDYFSEYFNNISLSLNSIDSSLLVQAADIVSTSSLAGNKIIVVGNGGSAAMASHVAVDFTKAAGMRAITFNEADLLTCFANDYGYEQWVVEALNFYADPGDVVILISSSGTSPVLSSALRQNCEAIFDEEFEKYLDWLGVLRENLQKNSWI